MNQEVLSKLYQNDLYLTYLRYHPNGMLFLMSIQKLIMILKKK